MGADNNDDADARMQRSARASAEEATGAGIASVDASEGRSASDGAGETDGAAVGEAKQDRSNRYRLRSAR